MGESSCVTIRLIESTTAFWRVREFEMSRTTGALGRFSLICESPAAVRRLWVYPKDWHSLSDSDLLALFEVQ
jgi:hypothetical protein